MIYFEYFNKIIISAYIIFRTHNIGDFKMKVTTTVSLPNEVAKALKAFREKFHINISHYVTGLIKNDLIKRGELNEHRN